MEMVIGVLGGMGPEATLYFYGELIAQTRARTDRDHLHVIIDSNPKVPDRIAAILAGGESPVPALADGAARLERAGADFIVMPCISAHFFLEELREKTNLPVLSVFDVVSAHIANDHPGVQTVGLLGTTGTIQGGRLQGRLSMAGIQTLCPEPDDQLRITFAILDLKDAGCRRTRKEIALDVGAVARRLVERGSQAIIAGCTELSLVLDTAQLPFPVFDSLKLLAGAAIGKARGEG